MTDKEVVMTQLNDLTAQVSTLCKKSYEQTSEFSTRVGEEATRVMEGQFGQVREMVELGMQTQTSLYTEWMKQTATARDMWTEAFHSFSKSFETGKPVKTTKAS